MLSLLRRFYRPAVPDKPIEDEATVERTYRRWRWWMFLSATFGYGFYYTCRLPLSVTKSRLADAGILNAAQMGRMGSTHKVAYAMGKLTNGFLADRVHLGRFLITGIVLSALLNLVFGLQTASSLMLLLWTLNGWMQSHGAPTSGVILANWFSDTERGRRYAVWSLSHHIGEALTFSVTALVVERYGWRWGYIGPALTCLVIGAILTRTTADRPAGLGLPHVNQYKGDRTPARDERAGTVWQSQREVLKSGWIWVLATSSALMYVARYAVNDWGVLYMEKELGYSLSAAGSIVSLFPIVGAAGSASSGWLSDRFFGARRTPLTVLFGLMLIGSQCVVYLVPNQGIWVTRVALSVAGIGIGALLVFLGGLTAMDIAPRRASGAALGLVGNFSYLGAAVQDWVSGAMIESSRKTVNGKSVYDFSRVRLFWIGASVLSTLMAALVWLPERRLRADADGADGGDGSGDGSGDDDEADDGDEAEPTARR